MPSAPKLGDGGAAADPEFFLGVRQSAKGLRWLSRLDATGAQLALAISQRHGVPELLGRVLAARGASLDMVPVLLNPTLKALMPDPHSLRDMERGARRLADAILGQEKIALFGDYDVDGACGCALLHRFLAAHGLDARIYIPDRLFEGYGPNVPAIESLAAEGANLIVTVDCGTTSFEPLAAGKAKGADIIVIDHHQAEQRLPEVEAVINPNRQDDVSGMGSLCATGVVFLTLVAAARELRRRGAYGITRPEPPLLEWLDLVALATVCDVVPLEGLNRAYVAQGLKIMRGRGNLGLAALADAAGLKEAPSTYALGFVLGPRINAGGRIGDSALGAKLLTTAAREEAARIAVLLDRLNRERKVMETAMLEAAIAKAEVEVDENPGLPIIVQGSRDWHKGLVGLVASRLTDRFGRPSLVLAIGDDGVATGSLRSISGVDIGAVVRRAAAYGLLLKGGGHAMAAGLAVEAARLQELRGFLAAEVKDAVAARRAGAGLMIDGALTPASVTPTLLADIERAGPFGQGNPTPRFVFPAHRLKAVRVMGDAHLRGTIEAGDGSRLGVVAFRCIGAPLGEAMLGAANGLPVHIAGQLRRDTWGGREKTELLVDDVADPRKQ